MGFRRQTLFQPSSVGLSAGIDAQDQLAQGVSRFENQRLRQANAEREREAETVERAARASYLSDTSHDIGVQATRLEREFETDTEGFANSYDAYADQLVASAVPEYRDTLAETLSRERDVRLLSIEAARGKKQFNERSAASHESQNDLFDRAIRANDLGEDDAAALLSVEFMAMVEEREALGYITPGQKTALVDAFRADTDKANLIGQMGRADDPIAFVQNFKENPPAGFSEGETRELLSSMVTRLRQDVAIEALASAEQQSLDEKSKALEASNLSIAVSRAGISEIGPLYEQAEKAFMSGAITGKERARLFKELDTKVEKEETKADYQAQIGAALSGAGPKIDYKDKDGVEAVGDLIDEIGSLQEMSTEQRALVANIVEGAGVVPDNVKAFIRTNINGPDALIAADLVHRMEEKGAYLQDQLSSQERALAERIHSNLVAGMAADTAIESAREVIYASPTEIASRKQVFNREFSKSMASKAEDLAEDIDPNWIFEADASPTFIAEYGQLFESHYAVNPDIKYAEERTNADMKGVWAVSNINGKRELKKFAPEAMYKVDGVDSEWMREQFVAEMAEFSEAPVLAEADFQTAREATNGKPTYPTILLTDEGAVPGPRWAPDFTLTEGYEEQIAQAEQAKVEALQTAKIRREKHVAYKRKINSDLARLKKSREKLTSDFAPRLNPVIDARPDNARL